VQYIRTPESERNITNESVQQQIMCWDPVYILPSLVRFAASDDEGTHADDSLVEVVKVVCAARPKGSSGHGQTAGVSSQVVDGSRR